MKICRPYQFAAISAIIKDWAHGIRAALIGMATGTGKTFTFCKLLEQVWETGKRAIIVVHQDSLMHQAYQTFSEEFGHDVSLGMVQGVKFKDYNADIIFAMVQSLNPERLELIGSVDYIVLDETHHYHTGNQWGKVPLHFMENQDALMLGCTATWYRTDNISMADMFPEVGERNELTFHYGIPQAMRDGFLAKFQAYLCEAQLDISNFSSRSGYIGTEEEWDTLWRASNWGDLLYDEWVKVDGPKKQTMMFAPSVYVSKEFIRWLGQEKDVIWGHVDGKNSWIYDPELEDIVEIKRSKLVQKIRNREVMGISNFGVFTEGTDFPYLEILIMSRPTNSPGLYTQMFGRVLRKPEDMPEKMAIILHVGFEDHQMRLVDHKSIIGGIPSKEVEEIEKKLSELTAGRAGSPDLVCMQCGQGVLVRMPGTNMAVCNHCQAMVTTEMPEDVSLFNAGTLNGLGSHARYIDMLANDNVRWYMEDHIYSVGIGVGASDKEIKADRTVLIIPPGKSPLDDRRWIVATVYRPVVSSQLVRSYQNSWVKYTFDSNRGKLLYADDKDEAFELADEIVQSLKDPMLSDRNRVWNRKALTDGQKGLLEKFGVDVSSINRGQGSKIIAHKLAAKYCREKGVLL